MGRQNYRGTTQLKACVAHMRTKPTLCRPITVSAVSRYRLGSQDLLRREMQHTPRKVAFSRVDPLCVRFFVCADFIIAFTATLYHISFSFARAFSNIFEFLLNQMKSLGRAFSERHGGV